MAYVIATAIVACIALSASVCACGLWWRDGDGEYGTGVSSVEESTLREWADRIRKLAEKEGE